MAGALLILKLGRKFDALYSRNFEGFFDDPYGTGEAAYQTVRGMQDSGVLATAKHYIGYEQETFRYAQAVLPFSAPSDRIHRDPFNQSETYQVFPVNEQTPISSNIDNQALHELYLWGFAEAVRAGTGYVMW